MIRANKLKKSVRVSALAFALALSSVAAEADALDNLNEVVNKLSGDYQASARYQFGDNDVKSFVYQWFAAFDHQREAGYYLNRISEPMDIRYPQFPIASEADFLAWYEGVTENIIWNSHSVDSMFVTGDQVSGWDVTYIVNWKAKDKNGQEYDLMVHQDLHIIRRGDALKISRLVANVLDTESSTF